MKKAMKFSALAASIGMVIFCFVTLGWFSDRGGFVLGAEFPVSFSAPLAAISDFCYLLAPFAALFGTLIFFALPKREWIFPAAVLLCSYALLRCIYYLSEFEDAVFWRNLFSALSFMLILVFVCLAQKKLISWESAARFAGLIFLVQAALLAISILLKKNLSQFYYFQRLYLSKYSAYDYIRISLSVFLYDAFYYLWVLFFALSSLCKPNKKASSAAAPLPLESETEPAGEAEEEELPLSLEDFGIEK